MPVKSKAQLGWLATHQKQIGGHAAFEEWLHATPDLKKLPEKAPKKNAEK